MIVRNGLKSLQHLVRILVPCVCGAGAVVGEGGWRADLIHTHFHAQVSMISRFLVNLKLLLSVDYDYLLLDYYYGVVWRAF